MSENCPACNRAIEGARDYAKILVVKFDRTKFPDLIGSHIGDIYHNIGINSTSINPFFENYPIELKNNEILIRFFFYVPKNSKGYYINNPFFNKSFSEIKYNNKEIIGYNEFEFLLPRGNYWYINKQKRLHRFVLRKDDSVPKNVTEWEFRKKQGHNRIWDCGNLKYIRYA